LALYTPSCRSFFDFTLSMRRLSYLSSMARGT
jgi:hypothetical protein